jgi:hypothetical protein
MKIVLANRYIRKHRKKALIIYLCWSLVKGLLLLWWISN